MYFCLLFVSLVLTQWGPQWPSNGPKKREWRIEQQRDYLYLMSKSCELERQDEFSFRLRLYPLIKGVNRVFATTFIYRDKINETINNMEFEFQLDEIVEFKSTNIVDIYTGEEDIVSSWPNQSYNQGRGWSDHWNDTQSEKDGVRHYTWEIRSKDGVLTLRVHVDQLIANGTEVKFLPNSIKYDIDIYNYPYRGNETRLALVSRIVSSTESNTPCGNCAVVEPLLNFTDIFGYPLGIFSWDPTVKVDKGKHIPVIAYLKNRTDQDQSNTFSLFFTFLSLATNRHPVSIEWDPLQGLNYDVPRPFNKMAIVAIVLAVALIVLLVLVMIILTRGYLVKKTQDYQIIN